MLHFRKVIIKSCEFWTTIAKHLLSQNHFLELFIKSASNLTNWAKCYSKSGLQKNEKSTSRDSSWTHFQTFLHISQQLCKRLGNAMKKRNAPEILFLGQNVLKHDYPVSTFKAWYLYSRASFLSPLVPYGVVIFEIKTCEVH